MEFFYFCAFVPGGAAPESEWTFKVLSQEEWLRVADHPEWVYINHAEFPSRISAVLSAEQYYEECDIEIHMIVENEIVFRRCCN
ncbi:MAG: hypothetical protein D6746_06105 [Bacteroidetes bacterium]|nr:MAG: hypothetical protein D6746_06105 [Bacteroidota bacterium]